MAIDAARAAKGIRAALSRPLLRTAAFALMLTIAAGGLLATVDAIQGFERIEHDRVGVTEDLQHDAVLVNALEWQLVGLGMVPPTTQEAYERERGEMIAILEDARTLGADEWSEQLDYDVRAYLDAVDIEMRLFLDGKIEDGVEWDRTRSAPAYRIVAQRIEQARAGRSAALARSSDLTRLGIVVVLIAGVALATAMFAAVGRARRRAESSERRAELEAELRHAAYTDGLTGLPSRTMFMERLGHALERRSSNVAVAFVDIDDFKMVNDSLGHATGDALLVEFASRLRSRLRTADTVSRIGGDEFAILLEDTAGTDPIATITRAIAVAEKPIVVSGRSLQVTSSAGVTLAGTGESAEDVLRHADLAMYQAKLAGKDRVATYETRMGQAALHRLEVEQDLRRAAEAGELRVRYQPVVRLADGRVVGLEALTHWPRRGKSAIPPSEFIPIAETIGLIGKIDRDTISAACADLARWRALGAADLTVAVNVSANELRDGDLATFIRITLARTGLPGTALCIEVTESAFLRETDGAIAKLHELRKLGVEIALDDFGTGYSSLSRFRELPVDVLKIDRSFVNGVARDEAAAKLLPPLLGLASSMGARSLAEGIEREEDAQTLRDLGCELSQGYLWSPPVPAEGVMALVDRLDRRARIRERRRSALLLPT